MWHTALITVCLAAVALAGPVPQGPYLVRRPQNSVALHSVARQRNLDSAPQQQQFLVNIDSREDSREDVLLSLQGIGNFAATAPQASAAPVFRNPQSLPQSFNIDGGAQFNVQIDDDSAESIELSLNSFAAAPLECPAGQLRHGSRCVVPRINRNIFVFGKDDPPVEKSISSAELPLPQLDYNIIFVRSRAEKQRSPVIVPPPQKKTVVYVLEDEVTEKELIEVPAYPDADPEVYYVKVRPGENPQLPGGLDLETAYSQAIRPSGSFENSFESSIELNIGAGGAAHSDLGQASFSASAQGAGVASFNSADAGFSSSNDFGVPLPSFGSSGDLGFNGGNAGFDSVSTSFDGGNTGFDAELSSIGNFAANVGSGSVGVPLPELRGDDFNFNAQSGSGVAAAGFDTGFSADSGAAQSFSGNAQFTAETTFGNGQGFNTNTNFAAKGLSVEIDDGVLKVEASSDEVVQPALRYRLPSSG